MKNIFETKKLEALLVARWSEFIDAQALLDKIKELVEENKHSFDFIPNTSYKQKGAQIMVSRFQYQKHAFVVWVDFLMPIDGKRVAVGTAEFFLSTTEILSLSKILGNIYDCG
jgi:hypothetical protein